jgi:hypothetical protein
MSVYKYQARDIYARIKSNNGLSFIGIFQSSQFERYADSKYMT